MIELARGRRPSGAGAPRRVDRSYRIDILGGAFLLMQQAATKHNAVINLP